MSSTTIFPRRILATRGNVTARWFGSDITLILTNGHNSTAEVVLDYGRAEGGRPVFKLTASSATNSNVSFRSIYSETLREVDCNNGDGPFLLFSNAMDTYRVVNYTVPVVASTQFVSAKFTQRSQRYQKLQLRTPNSTITFTEIGFKPIRPEQIPNCKFRCSNPLLNKIWEHGVRTVDMCTVRAGETDPAWDVTEEGTVVHGQHWSPCRQGTRWADKIVRFKVRIDEGGASWGVHMVVNGLIFCLDVRQMTLTAYEGLSHQSSVFPSIIKGVWTIDEDLVVTNWVTIETVARGDSVSVSIGSREVSVVQNLDIHPILGGSKANTGSIAFGGPEGWIATYRDLTVTDLKGRILYANSLLPIDRGRTFADFQVGTNAIAAMIDGAKRDRATFGGDLHISGRSVAYSTTNFEAVRGSIKLLTSHQTKDGYLGNLCPIQAPIHTDDTEPPTYAFYSITYALLLVVAIKNYWLHTGDNSVVEDVWTALKRLLKFVEQFLNGDGLVAAPPPMSLTFFPLVGPIFGASSEINLALYDALKSMRLMAPNNTDVEDFDKKAQNLKDAILKRLWNADDGILRLSDTALCSAHSIHACAYAIILELTPVHDLDVHHLVNNNDGLPCAFKGEDRFESLGLCSPYSAAFAAEACFKRQEGVSAVDLIERVWGPMTNENDPDYSGCLWEAMTLKGKPYHDSTSLVHAWSSAPVYLLPEYLAGVRPTKAGWREWVAQPVAAGLQDIQMSVSTPKGQLEIHWNFNDETGNGLVAVKVPPGSKGTIVPPTEWMFDQDIIVCCVEEGAKTFSLRKAHPVHFMQPKNIHQKPEVNRIIPILQGYWSVCIEWQKHWPSCFSACFRHVKHLRFLVGRAFGSLKNLYTNC